MTKPRTHKYLAAKNPYDFHTWCNQLVPPSRAVRTWDGVDCVACKKHGQAYGLLPKKETNNAPKR